MCGIAGYMGLTQTASSDQTIIQSMLHRGPDAQGVFKDSKNNVGLFHTRLSIIDITEAGNQPMSSLDRRFTIIFNGEIYNYLQLREELVKSGHQFIGQSDTEVLLKLYSEYGEDMLNHINGIFAFAIYDSQSNSIFIARDAIGVKPLYYAVLKNCIVFASEAKTLYKIANIPKNPNKFALSLYLTYQWCPGVGTLNKNINKLAPGTAMQIIDGKIFRSLNWYQPSRSQPRLSSGNNQKNLVNELREFLRTAVTKQMVSDVPVGAFLSGGLDSSAIVAFAKEINPDISCFTIDVDSTNNEGFQSDLPFAREVASHLKVPLQIIKVNADNLISDLYDMVASLDEPIADPAALNVRYICAAAKKDGIKVMLSGVGGDDIFTGYRRHQALALDPYWRWLPFSVRLRLSSYAAGTIGASPLERRVQKFFSGAALDGNAKIVNYLKWINPTLLAGLYTSELKSELDNSCYIDPMIEYLNSSDIVNDFDKMMALEQRFFLGDHNLIYTDKMSMSVGVEVRVPYLDIPLMEFANRIPSELKQRGMEGKWILKKAMEPFLPHNVIYRKKTGFGAPIRSWLQKELRDLSYELLSTSSLANRGLFNPPAVQNLLKNNLRGSIDASYTIFSLMCIEIWCRKFDDVGINNL